MWLAASGRTRRTERACCIPAVSISNTASAAIWWPISHSIQTLLMLKLIRYDSTSRLSSHRFQRSGSFFLENSGIFDVGFRDTQLFFSRQIGIDPNSGQQVPLDVGAKVTGSLGKYDVGILDAKTRASGPNPFANYFVARVKRKLWRESYVGALVTEKESGNRQDRFNRAGGIDANFILFKKLSLNGFLAKTFSADSNLRSHDWASTIDASYNSNLFQIEAFQNRVGRNFNPEVGFVNRTDIVTNSINLQLSPRPKHCPIREYNFEAFYRQPVKTRCVL